jgi:hypothetical protein
MALITDPNITAQLADLANTGTIDTNAIISILNQALPPSQQLSAGSGVTTGIYKRFGDFDKVNAKVEVVTTGLWSSDSGSLGALSFFTSSAQTLATTGQYYYNVYNLNPVTNNSAEVQFAVAYGHVNGSGSVTLDIDDSSLLATKATYAQYRSMLLDDPTQKFQFENGSGIATDSNDIYIVNVARARFREEMDAGNWSLKLTGGSGTFTFIDDSGKKFGDTFGKAGRVFKIVSGSLNLGTQNEATVNTTTASNGQGFGLFYPDRGIIVLNPTAIGVTVGTIANETLWTDDGAVIISGSVTPSTLTTTEQFNHARLLQAIRRGGDFEARRTEDVSTQHFFVRATNREFNYSNNPTYVNTDGSFSEPSFESDPKTFITTVGLLNDANEMIAVAKTSQPIPKSFDKEVLIKVKLSF